ncbi:hypothetical protein 2 [Hydrocotyle vulgaris tombusvirus]|nr:hypothetical protein 2 [Hydrocotyle vulgaris tombusvirus]
MFDVSRANFSCKHQREMHLVEDHVLRQERFAFHNCAPNELDSLMRRHVIPQVSPSQEYIRFADKELRALWRSIGAPRLSPLDDESLLSTRSRHVQRRWKRIAEEAATRPFSPKEALVKAFIKYEKYGLEHLDINKPPRAIQARGPLFTFRLAKYLVPIEHRMWNWKPKWNHGLRVFAKGRNAAERAYDLLKLSQVYGSATAMIGIDHSKFDSRVHVEHLKISHRFNARFYRGQDGRDLSRLMRCQLKNKCVTENGIFYVVEGRRMSGDIDTAKGNCEINLTVLRYILRGLRGAIYLDGDDSVVACHPDDVDEVVRRVKSGAGTGMQSTVEVFDRFSKVEFCQARPIYTNGKWMMMRNPVKAISNMCLMMKLPEEGVATRLATIGEGELHASSGCPTIYPFAKKLRRHGNVDEAYFEYRHKLNRDLVPKEPDHEAEASAWDAWDLPPYYNRLSV